MDAISGPATMLIFLLVYLRLRDEGIEEGMTFRANLWILGIRSFLRDGCHRDIGSVHDIQISGL